MFGELVRGHRQRLGLTQEELSVATGVHSRTIGKIEAGQITSPRQSTVRLLADAFTLAGAERESFVRAAVKETPPQPQPAPPRGRTALNQLPADVASFIGRTPQLDELTATLGDPDGVHPALITAIGGTAGVGKTALAVHWAHRVRHCFPDGQLYVNLRGYDRDQPMSTADALASFLHALGMPPEEVPTDPQERGAAYRSLLDGRRVLVLLDNASSVEQVRDLLPGSASCFALVTSRDSLGGLVARHGARRIELDLLSQSDSLTLLRCLVGARVDDEPAAAQALVEQCARLPLALRIAAELAAGRPDSPLSTLTVELNDQEQRLEFLDAGGDTRTAVSAVLSWSYHNLSPVDALVFRLLGLHPGADFDAYSAAVLAAITPAQARRALGRLARAHLVHHSAPDRYAMHDLLRAYAIGVAAAIESDEDRQRSAMALYEHYVDTTYAAIEAMRLGEPHERPAVTVTSAGPAFTDRESAQAWLGRELANIVAIALDASSRGRSGIAPVLSTLLGRYLLTRHRYNESVTVHTIALAAARSSGDRVAQALTLSYLGAAAGQSGQYADALSHLEPAIELARSTGGGYAETFALRTLALVRWHLGEHDRAVDLSGEVLEATRACGDVLGEAVVLSNRGAMHWFRGHTAQAIDDLEAALAILETVTYPYAHSGALTAMCDILRRRGRYTEAAECAERALDLAVASEQRACEGVALRDLGAVRMCQGELEEAADHMLQALARLEHIYPYGEALASSRLGEVRHRQGRYTDAVTLYDRALMFFKSTKDSSGLAEVLNRYGLTRLAMGEWDAARSLFDTACKLAALGGIRYEEAEALAGLGRVCAADGDRPGALDQLNRALTIYADLDVPEATELKSVMDECLPRQWGRSRSGPRQ